MFYCSQENETGALLFSRRRKLVHYCFQEKETGALLLMFSDEGKWCSTVLGIKVTGLYCTQEKGSGAIPSGADPCSTLGGIIPHFYRFFGILKFWGGYSGFVDFSSFNDFENLGVYSGFNENVLKQLKIRIRMHKINK